MASVTIGTTDYPSYSSVADADAYLAADAVRHALGHAANVSHEGNLADGEVRIAEIERLLATVHVQVNVPADVYVDGNYVGQIDGPGHG